MTYTYSLSENDFLQYQLYTASKSERVRKQMTRGRVINFIFFMCLAYFFLSSGSKYLGYYFLILGILMILFFPVYSKWRYKNYYKKYVKETFATRFDKTVTLEFNADEITTTDPTGKSSIHISDLDYAAETDKYFYLQLISGGFIIIPKENQEHITDLRSELERVTNHLNISYFTELNWKW